MHGYRKSFIDMLSGYIKLYHSSKYANTRESPYTQVFLSIRAKLYQTLRYVSCIRSPYKLSTLFFSFQYKL